MTEELLDNDSGPHFLALGMSGAPALEGFAVSQERGIRIRSLLLPLCLGLTMIYDNKINRTDGLDIVACYTL